MQRTHTFDGGRTDRRADLGDADPPRRGVAPADKALLARLLLGPATAATLAGAPRRLTGAANGLARLWEAGLVARDHATGVYELTAAGRAKVRPG
jgi:hypothetical protein